MTTLTGIRLAALGAVQVCRDGVEVDLERRSQLVLALLMARTGRTVGVTELVDLVWGGEPPVNAVTMVRRHVGVIRRALEPGLPPPRRTRSTRRSPPR